MIIIYFFLFYHIEENFILIHKHKIRKVSQTICVIYVKNVVYRVDFNAFFNNIFMEVFRCNFDGPLIQHVLQLLDAL